MIYPTYRRGHMAKVWTAAGYETARVIKRHPPQITPGHATLDNWYVIEWACGGRNSIHASALEGL